MTRLVLICTSVLTLAWSDVHATAAESPATLPGTKPLAWQGPLEARMMEGAHKFVERKIAEAPAKRKKYWNRDLSSREAYDKSVEPNRQALRKMLGFVDPRLPVRMERFGDDANPSLVAETATYRVFQVRWPVFDGVDGEGLLVEQKQPPAGLVVALPEPDFAPEQLLGLSPGVAPESQYARRLAERGFELVVPVLIDRNIHASGRPGFRKSTLPHRAWIQWQAFHMGRHIVGFEVYKVIAAVDWLSAERQRRRADTGKIGVVGYGEAGLVAFYAAALDTRIDAVLVSGYFNDRQTGWNEPIYRNVFGLLNQFGDAEIATLIAPRGLVVEYSKPRPERGAGLRGKIRLPEFAKVQAEFERIDSLTRPGFGARTLVRGENDEAVRPGSPRAIRSFAKMLDVESGMKIGRNPPKDRRREFDPRVRQRRQVEQLEDHVQRLVRHSEHVRDAFYPHKVLPVLAKRPWSTRLRHEKQSAEKFIWGSKWYRKYFWEEVLGKFDEPYLALNPRSRKIYDRPKWSGYDLVLDVYPELFAWGVLLVPKDLKPGERRPVVVCQHGLGGLPKYVIEGDRGPYRDFAAKLADRGFIVFAPYNLFYRRNPLPDDRFRWLDRKAKWIGCTLFSYLLAEHEQILHWLGSLEHVDAGRIAFYGLSYGGEMAARVPPVLEGYCLSICSAVFNDWTRKVASTDHHFSYMYSSEWEMPCWNMGNTFGHAEASYLMAPRPFMVERGHHDSVGRDRWVAHEYAKVRRLYTQLGLADKTEIEYFNGGHTINGQGTFRFLHEHLNWPAPAADKSE